MKITTELCAPLAFHYHWLLVTALYCFKITVITLTKMITAQHILFFHCRSPKAQICINASMMPSKPNFVYKFRNYKICRFTLSCLTAFKTAFLPGTSNSVSFFCEYDLLCCINALLCCYLKSLQLEPTGSSTARTQLVPFTMSCEMVMELSV